MPIQQTNGNAAYDSYGGGAAAIPNYIEDVFSTYLYTGTGATQTITNGIDLAGKGGLVWIKTRSNIYSHVLSDSARGATQWLNSATTDASVFRSDQITAFNSNGFSVGDSTNTSPNFNTIVSWSFAKAPKFFDVVTYTGDGAVSNPISHNLKSVPGFIIVKKTSGTGDWIVCNRYSDTNWFGGNSTLNWGLNSTAAAGAGIDPTTRGITSTAVDVAKLYGTVGSFDATKGNASGATYVMYVFAHDAGGFGLTGTDSVTYCGGVSVSSGVATVTLGWEPQWVMLKNADTTGAWYMNDNMRGMTVKDSTNATLYSNTTDAETSGTAGTHPTATGFTVQGVADGTYSFLAIRRGPMKVPTDGTKVYNVISQTPSGTTTLTNSFAADMVLSSQRSNGGGWGFNVADKLRGTSITSGVASKYLTTPTTSAEGSFAGYGFNLTNTNVQENFWNSALGISTPVVYDIFQRAPSFFDEVCYTGDGASPVVVNHNLGVVPEFIIVKQRDGAAAWYSTHIGLSNPNQNVVLLNGTYGSINIGSNFYWNRTATTFTDSAALAAAGAKWVAYLFATCPSVSKVGSYTGNGTTQTINCGFTGGARFVLIKSTDSTGDWYVWDTARGIVSANDPHLSLNTTAAEVTTDDSIDPDASGFIVNQLSATNINVTSATYIFLAIA